jgi:hypothetical protein
MSSSTSKQIWTPLRSLLFRRILAASFVADLGSFMQSVGAAWLMVSLHGGFFGMWSGLMCTLKHFWLSRGQSTYGSMSG